MTTILIHVSDDAGLEARLQAGFDLARATGGHLICQQATPYSAYAFGDPGLGAFPVTELVAAVEAARDALRARVEARLRLEGLPWDYRLVDGDPGDCLVAGARLADIVVMSGGPFVRDAGAALAQLGEVAVHSPAPVLVVPEAGEGLAVTGTALIAWDGSQEAGRAMRDMLPLLRLAEGVVPLTVSEKMGGFAGREAAAYLSRHGVHAEIVERPPLETGIEATIRAEITARRIAWAVLGAYGHSRLRELVFGGVTRGLLGDVPVPLFLSH